MFSRSSNYDASPTMFSPQGGLLQIEYAHMAADKGAVAVAVRTEQGVIMVTERSRHSPLLVPSSMTKMAVIADHILCVYSGIVSDANILVERARVEAAHHKFTYNEIIGLRTLVKIIGRMASDSTDPDTNEKNAFARPFGVSLLFAGIDDTLDDDQVDDKDYKNVDEEEDGKKGGKKDEKKDEKKPPVKKIIKMKAKKENEPSGAMKLFMLSPSGSEVSVDAVAIGAGAEMANKDLNAEFRKDMKFREAVMMCLRIMKNVTPDNLNEDNIEVAKIGADKEVKIATTQEVKKYLDWINK